MTFRLVDDRGSLLNLTHATIKACDDPQSSDAMDVPWHFRIHHIPVKSAYKACSSQTNSSYEVMTFRLLDGRGSLINLAHAHTARLLATLRDDDHMCPSLLHNNQGLLKTKHTSIYYVEVISHGFLAKQTLLA